MKTYIYKILIIFGLVLGFQNRIHAYITVPSTSYALNVGVDKYLSVPDAYDGYIDYAIWACSKSEISFKSKDAAGAIIQITKAFSGVAIVEVMATEKYMDSYGHTRARTYYKQYLITCIGGGTPVEDSEIILPEEISLKVGEIKHYNILSGDCYMGAFSTKWKYRSSQNFAGYGVNMNTGTIEFHGLTPGNGIFNVTTVNGSERDCKIVVTATEIVSDRRTETVALNDVKSLIASVLSVAETLSVENVIIDCDEKGEYAMPKHIYNLQGVLIKRNATSKEIKNLSPGIYIIGGDKVLVR